MEEMEALGLLSAAVEEAEVVVGMVRHLDLGMLVGVAAAEWPSIIIQQTLLFLCEDIYLLKHIF